MLVLATGCSFIASTTPPGMTHSCMPDRGPAHTDTAVVVLAALVDGALVAASAGTNDCNGAFGCVKLVADGAIVTTLALPYLASAIYGYVKDECPVSEPAKVPPRPDPT